MQLADFRSMSQYTALAANIKADANLPTEYGDFRMRVFVDDEGSEHSVLSVGLADSSTVPIVRIHSECLTGDAFGSLKCDCGPQLRASMARIQEEGSGAILYMRQEGRGIGRANKMRAYALQDEGFDTVEANHRLGFEDDERDFQIGASILKELKISSIRLMTNNPNKIKLLEENGVNVTERLALIVEENELNAHYLGTKAKKSGHLL